MGAIIDEWRAKKAEEDAELHDRLRAAVQGKQVELFADPRLLDHAGSPVHSPWDQLGPLLGLMLLALAVLLAAGVAVGIVAMTLGALFHLTCNRYFVAWRLRQRTIVVMSRSVAYWQAVWQMGGVALVLAGTDEPPCCAPQGDWRKFARRNLKASAEAPPPTPELAPPPAEAAAPAPDAAPPAS